MTRDARNPKSWTNREIEADSGGYKAAQQAHKADMVAAAEDRIEERDRAAFEAAYVAAGGTKSGAADAYRQKRDERAAEAARAADETARLAQRGSAMGRL